MAEENLDYTSLMEWFYFLCSLKTASVQLWYSPGKGLVGRAVAACPREALKRQQFPTSPNKTIWNKKASRVICSGFFFLFHGAAHPRYSCFLIGMLITSSNKIRLGDDEAPQQGLWRKSQSCLKGVLWEDQLLEIFWPNQSQSGYIFLSWTLFKVIFTVRPITHWNNLPRVVSLEV